MEKIFRSTGDGILMLNAVFDKQQRSNTIVTCLDRVKNDLKDGYP